ncbi:hypothetical protein, partial [Arthrobacter sp. JCM 19049]|uniref:hypothetical protein n=1 Tax=Arthrobacter sp. JCM 19049 TaxID=1460643 RepID=UPI002437026D
VAAPLLLGTALPEEADFDAVILLEANYLTCVRCWTRSAAPARSSPWATPCSAAPSRSRCRWTPPPGSPNAAPKSPRCRR